MLLLLMLLNLCCSLNIFNAGKSVGGHVKKSETFVVFQQNNLSLGSWMQSISENITASFQIKIHMVAEKTAENFSLPHPVHKRITESISVRTFLTGASHVKSINLSQLKTFQVKFLVILINSL